MLVLTRRENERIALLNSDGSLCGWIVVAMVDRGKVRLGFDFPKHINFVREELLPDYLTTLGANDGCQRKDESIETDRGTAGFGPAQT